MAFTFGFYNALNHDRKYNADQMSAIFDGIIEDGVFETIGEIFATVAGTGMQVIVKTGKAWFDHTWNVNDAWLPLFVDPSDVIVPRYDTVVLEVDARNEKRVNTIKIVKGIPDLNATKPLLLNTNEIHQHPLAHIRVNAGVEEITNANIEIVVGTSACPFVTGPLQTVPINDLWNRWNAEFNTWFDNLQTQLSGSVVTNLQNQINNKVSKSDKAAIPPNPTDDTHWVSPKGVASIIDQKADEVKVGNTQMNITAPFSGGIRIVRPCYLLDELNEMDNVVVIDVGNNHYIIFTGDAWFDCVCGDKFIATYHAIPEVSKLTSINYGGSFKVTKMVEQVYNKPSLICTGKDSVSDTDVCRAYTFNINNGSVSVKNYSQITASNSRVTGIVTSPTYTYVMESTAINTTHTVIIHTIRNSDLSYVSGYSHNKTTRDSAGGLGCITITSDYTKIIGLIASYATKSLFKYEISTNNMTYIDTDSSESRNFYSMQYYPQTNIVIVQYSNNRRRYDMNTGNITTLEGLGGSSSEPATCGPERAMIVGDTYVFDNVFYRFVGDGNDFTRTCYSDGAEIKGSIYTTPSISYPLASDSSGSMCKNKSVVGRTKFGVIYDEYLRIIYDVLPPATLTYGTSTVRAISLGERYMLIMVAYGATGGTGTMFCSFVYDVTSYPLSASPSN